MPFVVVVAAAAAVVFLFQLGVCVFMCVSVCVFVADLCAKLLQHRRSEPRAAAAAAATETATATTVSATLTRNSSSSNGSGSSSCCCQYGLCFVYERSKPESVVYSSLFTVPLCSLPFSSILFRSVQGLSE